MRGAVIKDGLGLLEELGRAERVKYVATFAAIATSTTVGIAWGSLRMTAR